MALLTQNKFLGLAPNVTSFDGQAFSAVNVDLSGGGIRPIKAPSYVATGYSGEIVYHEGTWYSGRTNYISTDIRGVPALISNKNGAWKLRMGEGDFDLWLNAPVNISAEHDTLPTPAGPAYAEEGSGDIPAGDYQYFTRFVQFSLGGVQIRSSKFSAPTPVTVSSGRVKFTRPAHNGLPGYTRWQIFRRHTGDTYAHLVAETSIQEAYLFDDLGDDELGETIYPESAGATLRDYRYVVVWVRTIGGWEHESVPSELLSVSQAADGVKITMTDPVPVGVTGWRIYRISVGYEPTTTFQLVAEMTNLETEYFDVKKNVELGSALQSSYRADNGALVTAGVPSEPFEGMAGPFNGFYVGWVGRDLYLSEPGNPAWWPGAYVVQANFPIVAVTQAGGNLAVVTEGGVQMGYGVYPDAFALSQAVFGSGGSYRTAVCENFYLGYNGIYEVTENNSLLISTGFDRDYFENMVNPWLVIEKEKMLLAHSTGVLVYDFKTKQWTTMSIILNAVYEDGGEIYGLTPDSVIVKLFGSSNDENYTYEGTASFDNAGTKRIEALKFTGTGSGYVRLYQIEDSDNADTEGDIDLDSNDESDKMVYPPSWLHTEAIRFKITGSPTIRAIMFEVEQGNTER